ncbi:DnaA/Hda family protein [Gammaproteobacteria bacterium]|nr:DnaA/Hda family protein [Gammaproteobacteria bacterium]
MKNINRKKQLFFDFGRDYEANLDNFFFSSKNKLLKSELENFLNGAVSQNVFLTASNGNGKTFLLNSMLNHELLQNLQVIYIDVALLKQGKNYFDELSNFDLICLDNIDQTAKPLEVQIFNLINQCKDSSTNLLFASSHHPDSFDFLPDLVSRFKAFKQYRINAIADEDVVDCLNFVASKLKLNYPEDLINYFSTRIKRDFLSIKTTMQDFDKFLYSEQKQPTKMSAASFLKN